MPKEETITASDSKKDVVSQTDQPIGVDRNPAKTARSDFR